MSSFKLSASCAIQHGASTTFKTTLARNQQVQAESIVRRSALSHALFVVWLVELIMTK